MLALSVCNERGMCNQYACVLQCVLCATLDVCVRKYVGYFNVLHALVFAYCAMVLQRCMLGTGCAMLWMSWSVCTRVLAMSWQCVCVCVWQACATFWQGCMLQTRWQGMSAEIDYAMPLPRMTLLWLVCCTEVGIHGLQCVLHGCEIHVHVLHNACVVMLSAKMLQWVGALLFTMLTHDRAFHVRCICTAFDSTRNYVRNECLCNERGLHFFCDCL